MFRNNDVLESLMYFYKKILPVLLLIVIYPKDICAEDEPRGLTGLGGGQILYNSLTMLGAKYPSSSVTALIMDLLAQIFKVKKIKM